MNIPNKILREKLYLIFKQKFEQCKDQREWAYYIENLNDVDRLGKLMALLIANENKIRIIDPSSSRTEVFLDVSIEFAEKVVTLGFLP
jgi:hypothetical protein